MGKRFAEHPKFDLSEINKNVLKKWDEDQVFAKSVTEREGCPLSCFSKDLLRPTVCRAYTMYWHAQSRIPSVAIKP